MTKEEPKKNVVNLSPFLCKLYKIKDELEEVIILVEQELKK